MIRRYPSQVARQAQLRSASMANAAIRDAISMGAAAAEAVATVTGAVETVQGAAASIAADVTAVNETLMEVGIDLATLDDRVEAIEAALE